MEAHMELDDTIARVKQLISQREARRGVEYA
jgi:hypothetical protein